MKDTPIVEGAYYEREDGSIHQAKLLHTNVFAVGDGESAIYYGDGVHYFHDTPRLTRRVYLVPTDPAEVVAELRRMQAEASYGIEFEDGGAYGSGVTKGLTEAAALLAEKLGVES